MKDSKLNPIIFVPGLMGSIGGEMLGCKINWSFGMSSWIYKPFISELEKLGYELDKSLFICYYDWRKSCTEIVEQFLKPLITEVENKNSNKKIDLLCHSMGGIVARTYIQGRSYKFNIRNFMCFGTPNKGNIEAYYLWYAGKEIKRNDNEKQLFEIIRRGYIWLFSKILDIPLGKGNIEKLHENFPGIKDLIPSDDYGELLCYKAENTYEFYPREYTIGTNDLLNYLNNNIDMLINRIENLYCFIGTNKETDNFLILDKEELLENKKGYVKGTLRTIKGDGTVTVASSNIPDAKTYIIEASHGDILKSSIKYISDIYKFSEPIEHISNKTFKEYPLSLILKKHINIELKNETEIVSKLIKEKFITKYESIHVEFGKEYLWIMIRNLPKGEYTLSLHVNEEEDHDSICIISPLIEQKLKVSELKKVSRDNKIYFSFKV